LERVLSLMIVLLRDFSIHPYFNGSLDILFAIGLGISLNG